MKKQLKKIGLFFILILIAIFVPNKNVYAFRPYVDVSVSLELSSGEALPQILLERWKKENTLQVHDSNGKILFKDENTESLCYRDFMDAPMAEAGKDYYFSGNLAIPEGYEIVGIADCRVLACQGEYDERINLDIPVDFDIQKDSPIYTLDAGMLERMSKYPSETPHAKGSNIDIRLVIAIKKAGESNKIDNAIIEIPKKEYTYTGHPIKPKGIKVRYATGRYWNQAGGLLKEGVDYKLKFIDNVKEGTAKVQAIGIGKWKGSTDTFQDGCRFEICPNQNKPSDAPLKKGQIKTSGTGVFKILTIGKKEGTVEYVKPKSSKYTKVTVPAKVRLQNKIFKVTSVGSYAFKNSKKLTQVTLGSCVETIKKGAFYKCSKLKKITVGTLNLKKVESSALKGISSKAVIKVPSSKLKAYSKLFKGKGQVKTVKIQK